MSQEEDKKANPTVVVVLWAFFAVIVFAVIGGFIQKLGATGSWVEASVYAVAQWALAYAGYVLGRYRQFFRLVDKP